MSGASACPVCGDIYYDPPMGDGPDCACADNAQSAAHAAFIRSMDPNAQEYVGMPKARYEAIMRVVEATREVVERCQSVQEDQDIYFVL